LLVSSDFEFLLRFHPGLSSISSWIYTSCPDANLKRDINEKEAKTFLFPLQLVSFTRTDYVVYTGIEKQSDSIIGSNEYES